LLFLTKKVVACFEKFGRVCFAGAFVLQEKRKYGHLTLARMRICYHTTQAYTMLTGSEDLQSGNLQMTIFSYLLQRKGAQFLKSNNHLF
jgi:hypothetical protein